MQRVTVPPGMSTGQTIRIAAPGGQFFTATIPAGMEPGSVFIVQAPESATQPQSSWAQRVTMGLPVDEEASQVPVIVRQLTPAPAPQAVRHAECAICFEPLCEAPCGVFLDSRKRRVSIHFFNLEAARHWLRVGNGGCPLTRQPVTDVLEVPALAADPDGWFAAVDVNGDGALSMEEAVAALKAQLPLDYEKIDAALCDRSSALWQMWDADGSGKIERQELTGGLAQYIAQAFVRTTELSAIPDMRIDKSAWYSFWDQDCSGSLEREEVVRALIKTLKLSQDQSQVRSMRDSVEAVWPIFDVDGSGSIERGEFLAKDEGLADTIVATLEHREE